jgi:hypothetical protein
MNCYLVASNDYDQCFHIFKAYDYEFHLKIPRGIQPNILKFFDMNVSEDGLMRILSMKDDEFLIDQVMCKKTAAVVQH